MVRTSEKGTSLCTKAKLGTSERTESPVQTTAVYQVEPVVQHESVMSHELDDSGPYAVFAKLLRASQALTERA
jgi:hypothetical protein